MNASRAGRAQAKGRCWFAWLRGVVRLPELWSVLFVVGGGRKGEGRRHRGEEGAAG